jgi:CRP-like cAMP-binding protein
MSLHPAEIAKEIKPYPFFTGFDESLLMQVCTMVRQIVFKSGDVILAAGKMNDKLYFLRSGTCEVLVDGERVGEISAVGEVMGEMSVLSGKTVGADIRAKSEVSCFFIAGEDFSHVLPHQKDRFQILLYKLYSNVLADRLTKTNEKAKMFEITARALEVAKRELETVTNAQINFMRSEQSKKETKRVLFLEPTKKQQITIKSAMGGTGVDLQIASSIEEAQGLFQEKTPDVIFCEETLADFLYWTQEQKFTGPLILLQSLNFNFELLQKTDFVQNVISRDPEDRAGTVKSLLTSLTKILHGDYFGPEKYLAWGTEIKSQTIKKSDDRQPMNDGMQAYFKSMGIRGSLMDRVQVAAEEMMMNAVYDAPQDATGKAKYNHLPRSTPVDLHEGEYPSLKYGSDGNMLAISVTDPFGAINRSLIAKYIKSCIDGAAGTLNTGKGGAGRGLHQILESCDFTIFNVHAGKQTEVIGLFDIEASIQKKDTRPRFQFFFRK